MKKENKKMDIYFLISILSVFLVCSYMHLNRYDIGLIDYIMLWSLFLGISISYFGGTVLGLIGSSIIIFVYSSYLFYQTMSLNIVPNNMNYVWIVAIPVLAFFMGKFSDGVSTIQVKSEYMTNKCYELATKDDETGLNNSKLFYEDLEINISRVKRRGHPLSLMMVEIRYYDQLKSILGSEKMLALLKKITMSLAEAIRFEDVIYRLDIKSMGIVLEDTDELGANVVRDRIKGKLMNNLLYLEDENKGINVDIRIGVLQYQEAMGGALEFKSQVDKEIEFDV